MLQHKALSGLTYPNDRRATHGHVATSTMVTAVIGLALILSAVLIGLSSRMSKQNRADLIPVAYHSIIPIPVPTVPAIDIRPAPSETPGPPTIAKSSVVPIPVPTPPRKRSLR